MGKSATVMSIKLSLVLLKIQRMMSTVNLTSKLCVALRVFAIAEDMVLTTSITLYYFGVKVGKESKT